MFTYNFLQLRDVHKLHKMIDYYLFKIFVFCKLLIINVKLRIKKSRISRIVI